MGQSDRREYLTATTLDQDFLDRAAGNLDNRLEMTADIETPTGFLRVSDKDKYVDGTFYRARLKFPTIRRTVGLWLSNNLEFSTIRLEVTNVDGEFNNFLPEGADMDGWIGKSVVIKLGLRDVGSTYTTIFKGFVTDIGGFGRSQQSIRIVARDQYDNVNKIFPLTFFSESSYPKIEENLLGKNFPVIFGNWNDELDPFPAAVPAFVVNGADPDVDYERRIDMILDDTTDTATSSRHLLDEDNPIRVFTTDVLPAPLIPSDNEAPDPLPVPYFAVNVGANTFQISLSAGGGAINLTTAGLGSHSFSSDESARENVELVITDKVLDALDQDHIYLKRGDDFFQIPKAFIANVSGDNNSFEVIQSDDLLAGGQTPTTDDQKWVGEDAYVYSTSDEFFVRVEGENIVGSDDKNIVAQARQILIEYGGLVLADFTTAWDTFEHKASPATSQIDDILSRIWVQDPQEALTYANSLLEQVRLETFVNRDLKWDLNALHFDEFVASPTFTVRDWDLVKKSLNLSIDDRNNFNRGRGSYNFLPVQEANSRQTSMFKNAAAITQAGKEISKEIIFPNLYISADVQTQVKEFLKLASAYLEVVDCSLTWRALLLDIGEFVKLDIDIGSTVISEVPCMIREIGYDPKGLMIPMKLWSFAMCPFDGYTPGNAGTIGGSTATIEEE